MENSVEKFLYAIGQNKKFYFDKPVIERAFKGIGRACNKKWLSNIVPYELLNDTVFQAVNNIMNLSEGGIFYDKFPPEMKTPNYGDKWGRCANYIEINNRYISEMKGNSCRNGIFGMIKILPAIPPSAFSWANSIILSQIFPNIYGDGYNKSSYEENSIYGIKLNTGYSKNIINDEIKDVISDKEQLRVFNLLAWFRGIKTGFRTVISADQIKVVQDDGEEVGFRWCDDYHLELFIREHVELVKLGFEVIFIDSAKHIGGYQCENYAGVGDLPEYHVMQYILYEIRKRSGNSGVSFVGEKSTDDFERYKNMGLTSGTDFVTGDDFNKVRELSEKFKYNREYAPGVEIENDNYSGGISYEQRLNRINTSLFAFYRASDKLPSFMQMGDIFPFRYDSSPHTALLSNPSYSTDGTPYDHYKNAFAGDDGREYNKKVGELFAHALQY